MRLHVLLFTTTAACLLLAAPARAQTDEIQVYDGDLTAPGVFNLTVHSNFTPSGIGTPAFPGAVTADKSFNGVPEWAYGVTDWFEAGLYMPLYSHDRSSGWGIDGMKLRTLFAVPHAADRRFFYGTNFEFSINAAQWDQRRFTSEVRPIIGWHLHPWDIIVNPILDTSYTGGLKSLDFGPEVRVAYNVSSTLAVAAEQYSDFGPIRHFYASTRQAQQLYGVVDYGAKFADIEAGIGFGLTDTSDGLTLKLMFSRDLNRKH